MVDQVTNWKLSDSTVRVFREFKAPDGKLYRCGYNGVELRQIEQWRCASRRTGRYHWTLVWPKWSDNDRKGPLPKGLTAAMVDYGTMG